MHRDAMNELQPPTQLLMACLGDASRFRLVQALMPGARCVSDLAGDVGLSQSCTTRHLQALERRGVVIGAREGKRVMYRLCFDRPELAPLLAWALRLEAAEEAAAPAPLPAVPVPVPVRAKAPASAKVVESAPRSNGPSRTTRAPRPAAKARPKEAPIHETASPVVQEPEPVVIRRRRPPEIEDYLL